MAGFGFGFGALRRGARPGQGQGSGTQPIATPLITPLAAWDGTAGTGFVAPPVDPVRTTAKPACRLIVAPDEFFADELLIGAIAFANNGGTLIDGVALRFHFEGATVDVAEPGFNTVTDANGVQRSYYGYWVRLKKPASTSGEAHLYVEAIPADATMQSRVIGPFSYFPHDPFPATGTLHDYELEIAPSQAVITGQRYQSVGAALAFLRAESLTKTIWNPRITYSEAGTFVMDATFWSVAVKGWTRVDATAPVVLERPLADRDADISFRPKFGKMRWTGQNITIDTANTIKYTAEIGDIVAFDGCNIINSRGRTALYRKGPPINSGFVSGTSGVPLFLECSFSNIHNAAMNATLVRGGSFTGCTNDLFTNSTCVVHTSADTLDNDHTAIDIPALSVQYTGAGAAATLELTGFSDQSGRTFTARVDGASVGTFTVQNSLVAFNAGTNYNVQNVADWLNGLAGWSATLIDDTRRASGLSIAGSRGQAFAATDAKTAPLTLMTHFDLHSDWWALDIGGPGENVIVAFNTAINLRAQDIFVAASSPRPKDFIFANNALVNKLDNPTGDFANADSSSQLGRPGPQNHVVLAHNSLPTQGLALRTDEGTDFDGFCLVANNAFRQIGWSGASAIVDPDLVIADNHIHAGSTVPGGSTGTSVGGDHTTLFADFATGDLTPAGDLLTNLAAPVVDRDLAGALRGALSEKGAVAAGAGVA